MSIICGCGFDPKEPKTTGLCDGRCNGLAERVGADKCQLCRGDKGGVLGNENVEEGVIFCDYCHVAIMPILKRLRAVEVHVTAAVAAERQWWLDNLDENISAVLAVEARRGR